ncbi:putative H/ACA RNP complex subunit Gar1/Naf1, Cbf5-binding domain-containing protein [Helianthus annuus]|nr:putative H/ACA RNP complex subunit Gar1/Naf1, Cbf5-binding domain-containing protein [Helianthus annuus]KAJ0487366.1 putative H/ACA RNP complex subunit Gar1/Naf1, Cbf5-binding domain-containing protein [Helianthus annuus]
MGCGNKRGLYLFWGFFSVKMLEGIIATSYAAGDKFYIDPAKLLPLAGFLPQPKWKRWRTWGWKRRW